jgi:hypothetical protein
MMPFSKRVIGTMLMCTMLLVFTLFFLLYVNAAPRNDNFPVKFTRFDPDKDLKLVHVVMYLCYLFYQVFFNIKFPILLNNNQI